MHARHVLTSGGASLAVVESGNGRPVVFVHGAGLSHQLWRRQLSHDAALFRVITYDQRGHGLSRGGHGGVSLRALADDLADVLEALDVRDAVVVGHSLGGIVLGRLAGDHAEVVADRVAGLVFAATTALSPFRALPWYIRPTAAAGLTALRHSLRAVALLPGTNAVLTFGTGASLRDFAGSVYASRWADNRDRLPRTAVPCLVVAGSEDRVAPVRMAEELTALLPRAELEIIDGGGHLFVVDHHAAFGRLLAAFSARVPPPATGR